MDYTDNSQYYAQNMPTNNQEQRPQMPVMKPKSGLAKFLSDYGFLLFLLVLLSLAYLYSVSNNDASASGNVATPNGEIRVPTENLITLDNNSLATGTPVALKSFFRHY